jgi:hypothetical protein
MPELTYKLDLTGGKNKQKNLYINGYISKKNKT